jgi:hypothetical protein
MEIIGLVLLTLAAAVVGTVSGFGMSMIMIPVLALFLPPVQAIFLVAIIHWFVDLWKIALFRRGFNFKLFALFGVTGVVASYLGASVSLGANTTLLLRLLGVFLTAYALFLIFKSRFKISAGNATAVSGGALSGFFAGMFGVGGAIRSVFLSSFNLPKASYIATIGAIGVLIDSSRIITYAVGGTTLPNTIWLTFTILVPISLLGAEIGKKLVDRIPQEQFRRVVAVFLFVVGIKLLLFP